MRNKAIDERWIVFVDDNGKAFIHTESQENVLRVSSPGDWIDLEVSERDLDLATHIVDAHNQWWTFDGAHAE